MDRQSNSAKGALGLGLVMLGAGLVLNSLLGPLFANVVHYPFTETVWNETLALEAVSLALVAPLAFMAGVLLMRGQASGLIVALGPASYAAYMLAQYVVGPQYLTYEPVVLLHVSLFALSLAILVGAWARIDVEALAVRSRGWAGVVLLFALFVVSRWAGAFGGVIDGAAVPALPADVTMYWTIFLLDLGIIVPVAIATAVGLARRRRWATKALYAVVGWFALVPPSVAAMALVKVWRGDPSADPGDAVVLAVVTVLMGILAVALYLPILRTQRERDDQASPESVKLGLLAR